MTDQQTHQTLDPLDMTAKVHFLVVNQCAAAGLHPFRAAWGTPGVVDSRSETKAEVICFTSFGRYEAFNTSILV